MKKLVYILFASLLITACAHHPDVRPGAEGIHSVVVKSDDTEGGAQEAIRQANSYCGEKEKEAVFVDEKSSYEGQMEESTYNNAKTASKVAGMVGAGVGVLGGNRDTRKAGAAVGLGGGIANVALGKGYKTQMRFRCQ